MTTTSPVELRGVVPESSSHVRRPTWTPDAATLEYGTKLNERVVAACGALRGQQ